MVVNMDERDISEKLQRLENTGDAGERNELAMHLAETGDMRVFDALLRLIQRPELENNRGTLVYSLEGYDCSSIVDVLANLVATGNFEVAAHAGIILEQTSIEPDVAQRLIGRLENARSEIEQPEWRRDLIEDTIAAVAA